MRASLVLLHRWLGLAIALFLFSAGLTGAVIAWSPELDAWLNPGFFRASALGPALTPLALADRLERLNPHLRIVSLPLSLEPGSALIAQVAPRTDASTGQAYALDYDQISVDPATGRIQGHRKWGAVSLTRLELIPLLYQFHYTLQLPFVHGVDTGTWLMGMVGIVWLFDGAIALVLAFPSRKSWRKSFALRIGRGGYPLVFDLHRSGGVWIWGVLVVMAMSSVSMNLEGPLVRPLIARLSTLAPTPFTDPARFAMPDTGHAALSREQIVAIATADAKASGIVAPPGALYYLPDADIYGVAFFRPGGDRGDVGLGNPLTYWSAKTGQRVAATLPGHGSAGDVFFQAQFPLHSGRIAGLPGRIFVSLIGLAVATLSVTGVCIWIKKRAGRRRSAQNRIARANVPRRGVPPAT